VGGAEAEERGARVDVLEVVVGVGDVQLAFVLGAVAVAVADERGLPVVVEVGVGDGDEVGPVGRVDGAVVVVLVAVQGRVELAVVNPDIGALLLVAKRDAMLEIAG